jgi:hypothetical protein
MVAFFFTTGLSSLRSQEQLDLLDEIHALSRGVKNFRGLLTPC